MGVPGRKPKPHALKVLEGGRAARRIERQGPPVKPPARCGRPTSSGSACQRRAGWGTDDDLGPCKAHLGQDPVDLADPPAYLPEKAKELWRLLAPDLIETDRLRTEDVPAFELLCLSYYFAIFAGATMVKEGITTKDRKTARKHPSGQVWKDNVTQYKQLAVEFGLTPSSRMRLQLPAGTDDPENPWKKY